MIAAALWAALGYAAGLLTRQVISTGVDSKISGGDVLNAAVTLGVALLLQNILGERSTDKRIQRQHLAGLAAECMTVIRRCSELFEEAYISEAPPSFDGRNRQILGAHSDLRKTYQMLEDGAAACGIKDVSSRLKALRSPIAEIKKASTGGGFPNGTYSEAQAATFRKAATELQRGLNAVALELAQAKLPRSFS